MNLKKSRRAVSYLLVLGLALPSVTVQQSNLCAAKSRSASEKNVETKRYIISKKAGTYSSSINVTVKAKKGYKVYYSTSGKFSIGKFISSNKKKSIRINKTKTLSIYAVKASAKVFGKNLKNITKLKKSKYFKRYKYIIQTQKGTSAPQVTNNPVATSTPPTGTMMPDAPNGSERPGETPPGGIPSGSGKPDGTPPPGGNNPPGGSGASSGVDSYNAVTEYTSDASVDGKGFESKGKDENAILVSNNATVNIKNSVISRMSSESTGGDNSSFYGVGAAVLATDGTASASLTSI